MKQLLFRLWVVGGLLLVALSARAQAYVPPALAGHVTDAASKLSAADVARLNAKLADYRRCSSNHVAVFVARSLDGHSVEDVAYAAFNRWKIGEAGQDNGALLVIAPAERKVRIETGKGVGGSLTDLQASDILRERVSPRLAINDFFGAIDGGTTGIELALGGCETRAAPAPAQATTQPPAHTPTRAPADATSHEPSPPAPEVPAGSIVTLTALALLFLVAMHTQLFRACVMVVIGALACAVAHSFAGATALYVAMALLLVANAVAWVRLLQGLTTRAWAARGTDGRAAANDSSSPFPSSSSASSSSWFGASDSSWSGSSSSSGASDSSWSSSSGDSSYSGGGGESGGGGASDNY